MGTRRHDELNLLTGIDRPAHGQVIISGEVLRAKSENALARWRGKHVGIAFRFFQLLRLKNRPHAMTMRPS